jgi:hypothetical protein
MANICFTAKFVLQTAKLYHEEQSPDIDTMSIFRVIFVLYSLIALMSSPEKELHDLFKEW